MRTSRTTILLALAVAAGAATSQAQHIPPPPVATGCWDLQGNAGTQGRNFLGTTDNRGFDVRVNNQRALRLDLTSVGATWHDGRPVILSGPTVLGGYAGNRVTPGAVGAAICGGGLLWTSPEEGGYWDQPNAVTEVAGTVGGGVGNQAGNDNADLNDAAYATVSGGWGNVAAGYASTVGGGTANHALGMFSTVAGGHSNQATGNYATIPGGEVNRAGGDYSFAAGYRATVRPQDTGTFVWADRSQNVDFTSSGPNQFLVRATGGVGINLDNPGATLDVNGTGRFSSFLSIGARASGGSTPLCLAAANQIGHCSSSLRYKIAIESFAGGLDLVGRLHPIAFTWREQGLKDLGLGAEQVEEVEPRLVTYNAEGLVEGVKYDRIAVVLVNAVRQQQSQLEKQRQLIEEQRRQIAELSERLESQE